MRVTWKYNIEQGESADLEGGGSNPKQYCSGIRLMTDEKNDSVSLTRLDRQQGGEKSTAFVYVETERRRPGAYLPRF